MLCSALLLFFVCVFLLLFDIELVVRLRVCLVCACFDWVVVAFFVCVCLIVFLFCV